MKEIQIERTWNNVGDPNNKPSKELLMKDTKAHIRHVQEAVRFISDKLIEQSKDHDHTKLEHFNDFYDSLTGDNMDDSEWYKLHVTQERHHLANYVHDDVNLIDIIEYTCDCVMAGLARNGNVYQLTLPSEVFQLALDNTVKMLIDSTEIDDNEDSTKDIMNMEI